MYKIALICSMSVSCQALKTVIEKEIQTKELQCIVECFPIEKSEKIKNRFNIAVLMPQVKYNVKKVQDIVSPIPVIVLSKDLFQKCNGKELIKEILNV